MYINLYYWITYHAKIMVFLLTLLLKSTGNKNYIASSSTTTSNKFLTIVDRDVVPPYFMKSSPTILSTNFFWPTPLTFTTTSLFAALFLWLNWWSWLIWCVILVNDIMDSHMSSLFTLVSQGSCCVFYATRC